MPFCSTAIFVIIIGLLNGTSSTFSPDAVSYEGYKVLRMSTIKSPEIGKKLFSKLDAQEGVTFLTFPTDMLVSPAKYDKVTTTLKQFGLEYAVIHDNFSKLIEAETEANSEVELAFKLRQATNGHNIDWKRYHSYEDIYNYCEYLANSSSPTPTGALVSMETIGNTTENRTIILMKVGRAVENRTKKAIWLDAGIHAREWITSATVTYILNTLVTDGNKSEELLEAFDWYIVPLINIDGYEFSRKYNRMWRKTRSRHPKSTCRGVDPNRNYDFNWGGEGSSRDPCSDNYAGPAAFSEPETYAVRNTVMKLKEDIALFITLHSYTQLVLVPWSGDSRKPADYNELYQVALKAQAGLKVPYGTQYRVGSAHQFLYVATGSAEDWAKHKAGIKYSYTIELRDKGTYGFLLPATQIVPSGIETFNGVKAMALAVKDRLHGNAENALGVKIH